MLSRLRTAEEIRGIDEAGHLLQAGELRGKGRSVVDSFSRICAS